MLLDEPVEELLKELPDAKQVLHLGRAGSLKYRGHHLQDFTTPLIRRGYVLQMMYAAVPIKHLYFGKGCLWCGGTGKFKSKWENYDLGPYLGHNGILQYKNHFVAWEPEDIIVYREVIQEIRGTVYDPAGTTGPFRKDPLSFQMLHKI